MEQGASFESLLDFQKQNIACVVLNSAGENLTGSLNPTSPNLRFFILFAMTKWQKFQVWQVLEDLQLTIMTTNNPIKGHGDTESERAD